MHKLYLSIDGGKPILKDTGSFKKLEKEMDFWHTHKGIKAWIVSPEEKEDDAAFKAHIRAIFKKQ